MRDEHVSTTNAISPAISNVTTANYAAVIADLRAKRDEIDRTIAMLEAVSNLRAESRGAGRELYTEVAPPQFVKPAAINVIPPNASGNNGIGEACARIVLEHDGELTTRQVTERLIASGFKLDDRKNPVNNVWSALSHRTKVPGDIEKAGKNWRRPARPYKGAQEASAPHMNGLGQR